MEKKEFEHVTVLKNETIDAVVHNDGVYVDLTLGGGGHSREVLKKGAYLIGIDQDSDAIAAAGKAFTCGTASAIYSGAYSFQRSSKSYEERSVPSNILCDVQRRNISFIRLFSKVSKYSVCSISF
jgi:16S rRNA C1402 N4-methylase RsmH